MSFIAHQIDLLVFNSILTSITDYYTEVLSVTKPASTLVCLEPYLQKPTQTTIGRNILPLGVWARSKIGKQTKCLDRAVMEA